MLVSLSALIPLFLLISVNAHATGSKRHSHVFKKRNDTEVVDLSKRGYRGVRATWYDVGLGACGKHNTPGDPIVALNAPMYGGGYPGPHCFKWITITCNGKTQPAQIMDECMGCPGNGGIDMSTGLFKAFADLGAGVLECEWDFSDGSGGGGGGGGDGDGGRGKYDGGDDDQSDDQPPPTRTKTRHRPAWTPPPPPPPPPTPEHTHVHTEHTTDKPAAHPHTTTKSAPEEEETPEPVGPQNILQLFQAIVGVGQLVVGIAT